MRVVTKSFIYALATTSVVVMSAFATKEGELPPDLSSSYTSNTQTTPTASSRPAPFPPMNDNSHNQLEIVPYTEHIDTFVDRMVRMFMHYSQVAGMGLAQPEETLRQIFTDSMLRARATAPGATFMDLLRGPLIDYPRLIPVILAGTMQGGRSFHQQFRPSFDPIEFSEFRHVISRHFDLVTPAHLEEAYNSFSRGHSHQLLPAWLFNIFHGAAPESEIARQARNYYFKTLVNAAGQILSTGNMNVNSFYHMMALQLGVIEGHIDQEAFQHYCNDICNYYCGFHSSCISPLSLEDPRRIILHLSIFFGNREGPSWSTTVLDEINVAILSPNIPQFGFIPQRYREDPITVLRRVLPPSVRRPQDLVNLWNEQALLLELEAEALSPAHPDALMWRYPVVQLFRIYATRLQELINRQPANAVTAPTVENMPRQAEAADRGPVVPSGAQQPGQANNTNQPSTRSGSLSYFFSSNGKSS